MSKQSDLLTAWENARSEHLKRSLEGCEMPPQMGPLLQIVLKEAFDAGFSAAVKHLGADDKS